MHGKLTYMIEGCLRRNHDSDAANHHAVSLARLLEKRLSFIMCSMRALWWLCKIRFGAAGTSGLLGKLLEK